MANGVIIQYGDIAVGAKEKFAPRITDIEEFSKIERLKENNPKNAFYNNPCELYSTLLNGDATIFPENPEEKPMMIWSNQVSNDDGSFDEPIILTFTSEKFFTAPGLFLRFDEKNEIHPLSAFITWYQVIDGEESVLSEKEFQIASAGFFCEHMVNSFNKIVIEFGKLNMPKNRFKLSSIDYGYGTEFNGKEIRSVEINQVIDPISTSLSISTADVLLDIGGDVNYSFQEKQPIIIYYDDELKITSFIRSTERKSQNLFRISCDDYIGMLNDVPFYGTQTTTNAYNLFETIFLKAGVPYNIDEKLKDVIVSGFIPSTTCRDALMQVAFASASTIDTSESSVVNVVMLSDDVKQEIPRKRIMQGQKMDVLEVATSISIPTTTSFTDSTKDEIIGKFDHNNAGQIVEIKSEKNYSQYILSNYNYATIIESGLTFVKLKIIDTLDAYLWLYGRPISFYKTFHTKENPFFASTDYVKEINIENATMVASENVDKILERCYNELTKTTSYKMSIVEGKHISGGDYIRYGTHKYGQFKFGEKEQKNIVYDPKVSLGDVITCDAEYLGKITGRVIAQRYNLNGNIIVKEVTIK